MLYPGLYDLAVIDMARKKNKLPPSEMQQIKDKELQDAMDAKVLWNAWKAEREALIAENKNKKRTKFPGEE